MPMLKGNNQVALGDHLYFFSSPQTGNTDCLIWAHGGLLHGNGNYNLANGLTLEFYVDHGQVRRTGIVSAMKGPVGGERVLMSATVQGPAAVENYTLRKAVGSGWKKAMFTYRDVTDAMGDSHDYLLNAGGSWCPNIVMPRRRMLKGKTISLGEVIDAVTQQYNHITKFIYGGCRSDYSQDFILSSLIRARIALYK